jgi:hypothetical protein
LFTSYFHYLAANSSFFLQVKQDIKKSTTKAIKSSIGKKRHVFELNLMVDSFYLAFAYRVCKIDLFMRMREDELKQTELRVVVYHVLMVVKIYMHIKIDEESSKKMIEMQIFYLRAKKK